MPSDAGSGRQCEALQGERGAGAGCGRKMIPPPLRSSLCQPACGMGSIWRRAVGFIWGGFDSHCCTL